MPRLTPVQIINQDRKWLLQAAYAYNHLEDCPYSDQVYDYTTKCLIQHQERYPEEWIASSMYPEVFVRNDDWKFTSQHFPVSAEIAQWFEEQQERVKEALGQ